jgi:hypothetical protein
MDDEEDIPTPIGGAIVLFLGAGLIVMGIGFFTYGVVIWARVGSWPHYPASKMLAEIGVPPPQLGWTGGQRAIEWLLSFSSCIFLIGIGTILAAVGARLALRHYRARGMGETAQDAAD